MPGNASVMYNRLKINYAICRNIPEGAAIIDCENPTMLMKACKNPVEIDNLIRSHVKDGVAMVRGSVVTEAGTYDITTYSCCVNTRTGTYYYKTYDDSRIRKVDLCGEHIEGSALCFFH